jgi:hypothetical protein
VQLPQLCFNVRRERRRRRVSIDPDFGAATEVKDIVEDGYDDS